MKKRQRIESNGGPGLVAMAALLLALVLAILPSPAQAQVACPTTSTGDFDGDGFTDAQECAGITLNLGTAAAVTFPLCPPSPTPSVRATCVDLNSKDAFVIMMRATPTNIPVDPYQFVTAATSVGGLGIAVHEITSDQAATGEQAGTTARQVTNVSSQLAARVGESLDLNGDIFGVSNRGMSVDLAAVFTERIKKFVTDVFASVGQTPPAGLIDTYIRHTIAHELGHVLVLTPEYTERFGGNHYKAGTIVVMEQSVTYKKTGTNVTFNISEDFTATDQTAANLLP